MMRTVIYETIHGDRSTAQLSGDSEVWSGDVELACGIHLKALYATGEGLRLVETFNSWNNGRGVSVGTRFREYPLSELLELLERAGLEELVDELLDDDGDTA